MSRHCKLYHVLLLSHRVPVFRTDLLDPQTDNVIRRQVHLIHNGDCLELVKEMMSPVMHSHCSQLVLDGGQLRHNATLIDYIHERV